MMSVFTPPTDNLYKFMALSGIVLMVAFTVPLLFFYQVGMEYLEQLRGSDELQVQEKFVNERLETLNHRKDNRNKELQKLIEGMNSASNPTQVDKLKDLIKEANREIESIEDASVELRLNLELKRAQVKYEDTVSFNRRGISRLAIVGGAAIFIILGFFLSIGGFWLWYKKLQRFQDRVVKRDAEDKPASAGANEQIETEEIQNQTQANVPDPDPAKQAHKTL